MKNKLSLLLLSAFVTTSVEARGLNGLYIGVGGGIMLTKTDMLVTSPAMDFRDLYATDAANVALVGGYGLVFQGCFYGGAEVQIDGNISSSTVVSRGDEYSITVSQNGVNFAALVRTGMAMTTKSMLYVGLGVRNFKTSYNIPSTDQINLVTSFLNVPYSYSPSSFRFYVELGAEGGFGNTEHFGWRVNYAYTNPPLKLGPTFPTNHFLADGSIQAKTTCHNARFTILYRF